MTNPDECDGECGCSCCADRCRDCRSLVDDDGQMLPEPLCYVCIWERERIANHGIELGWTHS